MLTVCSSSTNSKSKARKQLFCKMVQTRSSALNVTQPASTGADTTAATPARTTQRRTNVTSAVKRGGDKTGQREPTALTSQQGPATTATQAELPEAKPEETLSTSQQPGSSMAYSSRNARANFTEYMAKQEELKRKSVFSWLKYHLKLATVRLDLISGAPIFDWYETVIIYTLLVVILGLLVYSIVKQLLQLGLFVHSSAADYLAQLS